MKRIFVLLLAIVVSLTMFSFVGAQNGNMSGYIYSEALGLISLSCINTNSCQEISYGVNNNDGLFFGYGFAQNGEWVNFNPNYGGISLSDIDSVSGWAFSERSGWINLDNAKIISFDDIKKDIILVQNLVKDINLSSAGTMAVLNNLCLRFLNDSECNIINY